jgi:repressor LexA
MATMRRVPLGVKDMTKHVSGKSVSHVTQPDVRRLEIHFTDDAILAIELLQQRLVVALIRGAGDAIGEGLNDDPQPTRRQGDYLEFIARYIRRFGVSPAESDIGRHFLVSAPSVNQMVQTLERRGFITRQRGAPRSISIVHHADPLLPQHQPATVSDPRPNLAVHRSGASVVRAGR